MDMNDHGLISIHDEGGIPGLYYGRVQSRMYRALLRI